jgi:hypothetical protein
MLRSTFALVWIAVAAACGGQTVGDEGYFAGEPLPPPEKKKRAVPSAAPSAGIGSSAPSIASAPAAPAGPSCDTPPPGGWPKCNPDQTNRPCIAAGIGECFLHCDKSTPPRSVPCPQAALPAR